MALIKRLQKGTALTHAELDGNFDHVMAEIAKVTTPSNPTGVRFTTAPGTPTVTNTSIAETASVVNNNGTDVNIPAKTLTFALAPAGKKRKDAIIVDYAATTPTYVRIAGTEVNASDVAPTPSIPANRLFVRYLDVTDAAAITQQSALDAKIDKAMINVPTWELYEVDGLSAVKGLGPGNIFVMGTANVHKDAALNVVLVKFLVQTYETGHKVYKRWVTRNFTTNAITEDTGWVEVGGGGGTVTTDATIIDGSTNPVQGNAVFDALQLLSDPFSALTFGVTTTWATGGKYVNKRTLILTGNTTLAFTGLVNGAEGTLILIQDATGARTFTLPTASLPSTIAINTAANGRTLLGWVYDGTNIYWTAKNF